MAVILVAFSNLCFAQDEGIELTIYNQNLGLVKDRRSFFFEEGINRIEFKEVASQIDPTSVHFKSLTAPQMCSLREQIYEYDLVNTAKLLSRYLNKKIKVLTEDGSLYEGTLLSYDNQSLIISTEEAKEPLSIIRRGDNIRQLLFPQLPEGLITRPTLLWEVCCQKKGEHLIEVSYLTNDLNWHSEYVAIVDREDKRIDLDVWATIENKSGITYKDANLKLVAGQIHRLEEEQPLLVKRAMAEGSSEAEFVERPFFEYHMYSLQRRITLRDNQTKQVSLVSASNIPAEKLFIYDGAPQRYPRYSSSKKKQKRVNVKLELTNSKENNLGMPLPGGKVRIYKKDEKGSLQFIGEDLIEHIPEDERFRLYVGDTFDLVGERACTATRKITKNIREEDYKINLSNHKDQDVEIIVVEHLRYRTDWTIVESSHDYTKKDAQTIEFKVKVPQDGETTVNYTVRYIW